MSSVLRSLHLATETSISIPVDPIGHVFNMVNPSLMARGLHVLRLKEHNSCHDRRKAPGPVVVRPPPKAVPPRAKAVPQPVIRRGGSYMSNCPQWSLGWLINVTQNHGFYRQIWVLPCASCEISHGTILGSGALPNRPSFEKWAATSRPWCIVSWSHWKGWWDGFSCSSIDQLKAQV